MPVLTVRLENGERRIPFTAGRSLRDILDTTDLRVRSGCNGQGACGLCRVRVEEGEAGELTHNERLYLDSIAREEGVRLACQLLPARDLRISILARAPRSLWRSLPEGEVAQISRFPSTSPQVFPLDLPTPRGIAVDLGTTHIRLALYDLVSGRLLAGRCGLNPQTHYGSDVMTRLLAASDSTERADDMGRQVVEAIAEGLFDMAVREGIDTTQVTRFMLVGNTAMLALLSGRNHGLLLHPGNWMNRIDCLPKDPMVWCDSLRIHPGSRVDVLPSLGGFVGSDLLAGVAATRLVEGEAGALFIDFGTNSEIALWDGQRLWVASAAGGPAFEESGMGCGMPAEAGAICRVRLKNGGLDFDVIADDEPRGLCGSGLVDLVACLVDASLLTPRGNFAPPVPSEGYVLDRTSGRVVLTKRDVDLFQRAKAAIASGTQALLSRAGMERKDLRRICIGGFFGRFLDPGSALRIGLLPAVSPERIELRGCTALAGCAEALLSPDRLQLLKRVGKEARLVDLSRYPGFDELYLNNLYLLPTEEI